MAVCATPCTTSPKFSVVARFLRSCLPAERLYNLTGARAGSKQGPAPRVTLRIRRS